MICQFGRRAKVVGIGVILTAALSIASVGGAVETITAPKLVPQYRLNELLTRLPAGGLFRSKRSVLVYYLLLRT